MTFFSRLLHLDRLESEAIYILREAAAQSRNPALLFSGGKDSAVLLHLALKAFRPEKLPFPLLHVDTGHNFEGVTDFRDATARRLEERLIVAHVEDSIQRGSVRLASPLASRNAAQAVTLLEAIETHGFDLLLGGARRDEDKARAKERVFSHRDAFGAWNPKSQRPELWDLYNGRLHAGENFRVFPLSNWTELDIWTYIEREKIALPDLYFAHMRRVVRDGDLWRPVTPVTPEAEGEHVEERMVRFRTVGDMTCTCPIESQATSVADIIAETRQSTLSERGATRLDDKVNEAAMERRKKEGYF
ncbi:sulfate adenylyltransferase subunit 2 [Candidatus Phycosocius bacilliformis]|uniref:Sulfate adenylyltransferase subunit 2 n=1 Tax=Candidatus Phycosocius bacilliformis TaxID=1445552 RepID=A0A2P2ECZ1_9PROT|nr:sulfate adenylyltransferase subunit CysD [Candidatus Phycosocius bacilliformis]GBF58942.1 sulfate adenylyltransferase subunit 2 [Candidatus Phycosocius bacilliformis]